MSTTSNKFFVPTFFAFAIATSGCGSKSDFDSDSAKATAEREAAAQHFEKPKYIELKPIGAESDKIEAEDAKASDTASSTEKR